MSTMNVSLPEPMKSWVEARLKKEDRFSNKSDYIRYLIRRDQVRNEAIDSLQKAIDEGINSGDPKPFDSKVFKARMKEQYGRN